MGVTEGQRLPVWHSPKYTGKTPYPHRGVDIQMNTKAERVAAPMSGLIMRRPHVYLDTDAYAWVVVGAMDGDKPLEMKLARVSSDGPAVGTRVDVTTVLGRQQSLATEDPDMTNAFVHWEVMLDGHSVDPTPFRASTVK